MLPLHLLLSDGTRSWNAASHYGAAVLDEMVEAVEALGMEVHIVHSEESPSQLELSIMHTEALQAGHWTCCVLST